MALGQDRVAWDSSDRAGLCPYISDPPQAQGSTFGMVLLSAQ